jgi:hypothetical protein
MCCPPCLHALKVFRPAEGVSIFWTGEPASLTRGLARVATLWCRAITLSAVVAWIGLKELTAVGAFAFGDGFHTSPHPAPFAQRQSLLRRT